jgi:hypothetical protein
MTDMPPPSHAADGTQAPRAELVGMKPGALKKRAREAGVTTEQLDDADDEDDPQEAVIALILKATPGDDDGDII